IRRQVRTPPGGERHRGGARNSSCCQLRCLHLCSAVPFNWRFCSRYIGPEAVGIGCFPCSESLLFKHSLPFSRRSSGGRFWATIHGSVDWRSSLRSARRSTLL